ncbi:MAG: hypothetical protein K2Z25_19270 [Beijerinckiaceae bacterium]|nr:hypothetical protein [Beijerinckiaceae bacterium]
MDTKTYIEAAIRGFLADPPDTDYQRGYLAALVVVYGEAMDGDADLIRRADLLATPSLD